MIDYKQALEQLAEECRGACAHCSLAPHGGWCVAVRDMELCKSMRISAAIGKTPGDVGGISDNVVEFDFPSGTLVKIEGLPFWLAGETTLVGHPGNVELLRTLKERSQ